MTDDNVEWEKEYLQRWEEVEILKHCAEYTRCDELYLSASPNGRKLLLLCVPKLKNWEKFYKYDESIADVELAHSVIISYYEDGKVETINFSGENFACPSNNKSQFCVYEAFLELRKIGEPHIFYDDNQFFACCIDEGVDK